MEVETLESLAAAGLADALYQEKRVLLRELPSAESNLVFKELVKGTYSIPPISNSHNLNVTEADYQYCNLSYEDVQMLSKFNLRTLKFNLPEEGIKEYIPHGIFNIVKLMKDALNPYSRENLEVLSIGNGACLNDNFTWLGQILRLLPNLRELSLNFQMRNLFPFLNQTYPNLRHLDISQIGMHCLGGISNFPNLEVLIISNIQFEASEEFEEIAQLEKLRYLDISQYSWDDRVGCEIFEQFLSIRGKFPVLEFLDLSYTDVTERRLPELLSLYPTLRKICLYKTACSAAVIANVEVLSASNMLKALKILEHFEEKNEDIRTRDVLIDIFEMVSNQRRVDLNRDTVEKMVYCLLKSIEKIEKSGFLKMDEIGFCFTTIIRIYVVYQHHLSADVKCYMVTRLLNFDTGHMLEWFILGSGIVDSTPNLDLLFVCQRCIDFLWYHPQIEIWQMVPMMNCLKKALMRVPQEKKNTLRRVPNCLSRLFDIMKNLPRYFVDMEARAYHASSLIYECVQLLLIDSNFAYPISFIYELLEMLKDTRDLMAMKLPLICFIDILTSYHVHFGEIPSLVDVRCVQILLRCLCVNNTMRDEICENEDDIISCLSFKILAFLLKEGISELDQLHFATFLLENVNQDLDTYFVRAFSYVESEIIMTSCEVNNAREWAQMTIQELHIFIVENHYQNRLMFNATTHASGRNELRNIEGKVLRRATIEE